MPLNTALYEPPLDPELPALDSDGDSDDGEDGKDDGKKHKGSSVSCFHVTVCDYKCTAGLVIVNLLGSMKTPMRFGAFFLKTVKRT